MKILLLGFSKIKYMPYTRFYIENIDRIKNEVHVLYWNRDLKEEDISSLEGIIPHEFKCWQEDNVSKLSKISSFLKYRKHALKLLKKEKFDFLIILHTFPGVLLYKTLLKVFKYKYIFDYRDSTYEKYSFFQKIISNLVKSSLTTFVSSDAFRKFMPPDETQKILTSHNILLDSLNHREDHEKAESSLERIRVSFWGFIREEALNKRIIEKFSEDLRFELHYYGKEQQIAKNLKNHAQKIKAKNVFFHGEYQPEDRYEFIKETNIIHNIYCSENMMLAMGNKYYDGAIFRIPQLCMKNSFMADMVNKSQIGLSVDPDEENFTEEIFQYYSKLNKQRFKENCDKETDRFMLEYRQGCERILNRG